MKYKVLFKKKYLKIAITHQYVKYLIINIMKEEIKNSLDNPRQLEKLYRDNKANFKKIFDQLYPEIQHNAVAQTWHERLHFEQDDISWGSKNEVWIVVLLSLVAGLLAKLPDLLHIEAEYFYSRHLGFVVLPVLMAYFAWKQALPLPKVAAVLLVLVVAAAYINLLPNNNTSDTLVLACIHLPLFLWAMLGFTFTGQNLRNYAKRIEFLRYNGELVVISTIILIAGGILSGLTIGLFNLISINIEKFYFENIVVWGLAAAPMVGTFLVHTNPQLVRQVSPIIAKVFTPLVLATLTVYLAAIVATGKDPYTDREFLIIFNLLLVGVMAIIFFSIAETSRSTANKAGHLMLLALSLLTIVVNVIALSAIVFRISEWGITPNRLSVLGGNVLMLTNLTTIAYRLFRSLKDADQLPEVENSIAAFLPVYSAWTVVVTFVFPLVFGFK